ncbi:MAG: CYTH domain-containing protein [archaeon]
MHEIKSPMEVEIKLKVDEKEIVLLIGKLGKADWIRQENIIFRTSEGFVRFRREGGKAILTIKGKGLPGDYNERPEVECRLPLAFFDQVLNSMPSGAIIYEKQRASYNYGGCTVCLDNLGGQYFVEIEGEKEKIDINIVGLQLGGFQRLKEDYAQIVSGAKK